MATRYIIAMRGMDGMPIFPLTGKVIDNGPGKNPSYEVCGSVHSDFSYRRAKWYNSVKEIALDPMTHHPHFWDQHRIFMIQELDNP